MVIFVSLLEELRCNSLDDLLAKMGIGAITARHLERALIPKEIQQQQEEQSQEEELLELIEVGTAEACAQF